MKKNDLTFSPSEKERKQSGHHADKDDRQHRSNNHNPNTGTGGKFI